MITIGIVTHNDGVSREDDPTNPDIYFVILDLIRTIDMFTEEEYVLIIRDNLSFDYRLNRFHISINKYFSHMNIRYFNSDVNSLTDSWNQIIDMGLNEFDSEAITVLNQDVILTKYWKNFISAIKVQSRNILSPMTTNVVYQPLQQMDEEHFEPDPILLQVPVIQGFCWGASKQALVANMYDDTHYFDPEVEWKYNEEEWQQRNTVTGGKSLIVMNSYIIHLDQTSWDNAGLRSTKHPANPYREEQRRTALGLIDYDDYLKGIEV